MEEGQPGSPKDFNRTGKSGYRDTFMTELSGTGSNRIPEARDFSHEKRFHYTYIPIAQTLVLLVADGFITLPKTHLRRGSV